MSDHFATLCIKGLWILANWIAGPQSVILLTKETSAHVFSCEFCKIFTNNFSVEKVCVTTCVGSLISMHSFLYKQCFFSTQPQCCLIFSWIEPQMFLRCCLIYISIIIPRHFLYLLYLYPCLDVGLIYVLSIWSFFIFILILQTTSPFAYFLEYIPLFLDENVDEECKWFSNNKSSASGSCLELAWFFDNFSLALLIKVLFIKKAYICSSHLDMQRRFTSKIFLFLYLSFNQEANKNKVNILTNCWWGF